MPRNKNKKFKRDPAATIGTLSKNLLGLKFMQRAKKQAEKVVTDKDESFDTPDEVLQGMNLEVETIMMNQKREEDLPNQALKRGAPPQSSDEDDDDEIDDLADELACSDDDDAEHLT